MDLLNKNDVRRVIQEMERPENKDRREDEIKAFEIYSGKLNYHVSQRLKYLYPQTHRSFSVADLNLSRKIVDKMSKSYKQTPLRLLDNDIESEDYQNLMKDMHSAQAWKMFDVYYNLHRYACMWFNFVEIDGEQKLLLRPLNPSQFARVVDDVGRTRVFVVNFPDSDLFDASSSDGMVSNIQDSHEDGPRVKRYAMWTDDQHVVVRVQHNGDALSIMHEPIEGNEAGINELGIIPAVFAQQGDNAALPILNPITDQTIEFNQQYSVMLTGASVQTFGHLVLSHPEDQPAPDEIYNSLFTYSKLPQRGTGPSTTLDYLNPSPNLDSHLQVLQNYGHQIITEHLGDGSQNISGSDNFTSGLDRMIAMSDITNIIESNRDIYAQAENELYHIIKAYFEANNSFRFRSEDLVVKYPKAKPIQSESEILANIEKKLDMGLIEKYEALLMLDPNMGVDQAKEKIEKINEEKMNNMQTFFQEPSFNGDDNADQEE